MNPEHQQAAALAAARSICRHYGVGCNIVVGAPGEDHFARIEVDLRRRQHFARAILLSIAAVSFSICCLFGPGHVMTAAAVCYIWAMAAFFLIPKYFPPPPMAAIQYEINNAMGSVSPNISIL
jgi:hypothetical protein